MNHDVDRNEREAVAQDCQSCRRVGPVVERQIAGDIFSKPDDAPCANRRRSHMRDLRGENARRRVGYERGD